MDISPTGTGAGSSAAPVTDAASASNSNITADFETFLNMLTTQMKNQDPLNPVESSDFAVQLATFSGVEQQVITNDLLRAMGAADSFGGLSQHAAWVGMDARSTAPIRLAGNPVDLHYDLPLGAVAADLVVRDSSGLELHRLAVAGPGPLVWDGTGATGAALPPGDYAVTLESRDSAGAVTVDPVSSYARVAELRADPGGPVVVLEGGAVVPVAAITALRAAP